MLIGLLAACGGSDDTASTNANTDEAGPAGSGPDAGTQGEAGSASAGSSSSADTTLDGSAGTSVDGTAESSSTDASSSTGGMDSPPMDGPSTHDTDSSGVIESDTGGVGGDCISACDCMQGLGCTDTLVCAPVPSNAYCCEKPDCPIGAECEFSDGSLGVCPG